MAFDLTNQLTLETRSDAVASFRGGDLEARRPIAGYCTMWSNVREVLNKTYQANLCKCCAPEKCISLETQDYDHKSFIV